MESIYSEILKNSKIMSKAEEYALFRLYNSGGCTLEQINEKLLYGHIKFIVNIVNNKYKYKTHLPEDDLIAEGCGGMFEATPNFDITKNKRFNTYAVHWIRARIGEYIEKRSYYIRLPHNKFVEVRKSYNESLKKNGKPQSEEHMQLMNIGKNIKSLDSKLEDNETATYSDVIADKNANMAFESIESDSRENFLLQCIEYLDSDIDKFIIKAFYGFYDKEINGKEIARITGINYNFITPRRDAALIKLQKIILSKTETLIESI